jgi:hypothetical protein
VVKRVRSATTEKLNRVAKGDRLSIVIGLVVAVSLYLAFAQVMEIPGFTIRTTNPARIEAVVQTAANDAVSSTGQQVMRLYAVLPNGRVIYATGIAIMPPAPGTRIKLRETESLIGKHTYFWEGEFADSAEPAPDKPQQK